MDQVLEKQKPSARRSSVISLSSPRADHAKEIHNQRGSDSTRVVKTLGASLGFCLERDGPTALQVQLYQQLREAILTRRLSAGMRLPGTRYLARELNCSRNTILGCFEELTSEGYLEGRTGSGTYVARALPEGIMSDVALPKPVTKITDIGLSNRGRHIAGFKESRRRHYEAFQCLPDVSLFPFQQWERLTRIWRHRTQSLTLVSDPCGYWPLRESICDYLHTARNIECKPEQVLITTGIQHGIDLAARMLLDPGDAVWIEDGGYPGPYFSLYAAGAMVVPSACDREGLKLDRSSLTPLPRMIVVNPSQHFSIGSETSLQRRLDLLHFAAEMDSWIIESDYNSDFRYSGKNLVPLHRLDGGERVVYVGTFSNMLFPALQLGFMVVPHRIVDRFATGYSALSPAPISIQPVLDAFIREGYFEAHVRRMRMTYRNRQAFLLDAIEKHLTHVLQASPAAVGMHLVARFTAEASGRFDEQEVAKRAAEHDIAASPLSHFYYAHKPEARGLILGYTAVSEEALLAGVHQLARVLSHR